MKYKLLLILLTIPLFISLIRPGFFSMQDDLQAFRVHQMVKCLKDFQIPCRWVPDMGYQYGYPQFNFYPPSVFLLGGLINLAGIQLIDTVKVLFILGFVLSALTMFIFLQELVGEWPAFVGVMLYSIAPYKATEVYVRGSLSEFWAFVFFPLIFWATLKLIKSGQKKYIGYLALSVGLLLLTHNLMAFIFMPLFVVWIVTLVFVGRKWSTCPKVIFGTFLGLGVAAFFTLPVIFENKYVHIETLTGGYFDYRQHFVGIKQLFLSNHFGYGSSYLGPNDDLSQSTGIVQWVLALICVILALFNFKKDKNLSTMILTLAAVALVVLFLMHQQSSFIWEKLPLFSLLQFPWRFLSASTFLLSILGAIAIYMISSFNKGLGVGIGILTMVILLVLHGSFFQPKDWLPISDKEKFSGESWEKQLTISIFDYLPIFAKLPPNKKAPELPETLDGNVEFINYQKGSNFQIGEIKVATSSATLRLPLFDFPGMEVKIDGNRIKHWHNDCRGQDYCLGLITFTIGEGTHKILAQLKDTPIRTVGNLISLISIIALGLLLKSNDKSSQ